MRKFKPLEKFEAAKRRPRSEQTIKRIGIEMRLRSRATRIREEGVEINVRDKNNPDTWPDRWIKEGRFSIAAANQSDIEITFGLPLKAEPVQDIVFTRAGPVSSLENYLPRLSEHLKHLSFSACPVHGESVQGEPVLDTGA